MKFRNIDFSNYVIRSTLLWKFSNGEYIKRISTVDIIKYDHELDQLTGFILLLSESILVNVHLCYFLSKLYVHITHMKSKCICSWKVHARSRTQGLQLFRIGVAAGFAIGCVIFQGTLTFAKQNSALSQRKWRKCGFLGKFLTSFTKHAIYCKFKPWLFSISFSIMTHSDKNLFYILIFTSVWVEKY